MRRTLLLGPIAALLLCSNAFAAELESTLVADINDVPVAAGSSPDGFVAVGNLVLFTANDLLTGRELWRTDGTPAGTFPLLDACTGECSGGAHTIGVSSSGYFFETVDEGQHRTLWFTAGTAASTVALRDGLFANAGTWLSASQLLVFFADDGEHGFEPWASDGTPGGTQLLADLEPGAAGFLLRSQLVLGGQLLFTGFDSTRGPSLWRTDGRAQNTVPVRSWGPTLVRVLDGLAPMGARAAFLSSGPGGLFEVWRTDGTTGGTARIASLGPPAFGGAIGGLGSRYLFSRFTQVGGSELWATDGTAKGTRQITFFKPSSPFGGGPFVRLGNRLVFAAASNERGPYALWATDGTPKGTKPFANVCTRNLCSVGVLGAVNGRVLVSVDDGGNGDTELTATDGTRQGTVRLPDICPGACGSYPRLLAVLGQRALILGFPRLKGELWTTNGTVAGTSLLRRFERAGTTTSDIAHAVVGGRVYFTAAEEADDLEPWRTDGTVGGTEQVVDIVTGVSTGSQPVFLRTAGSRLFFFANDGEHGYELWTSDGTAAGTRLVRDEEPGPEPSQPPNRFEATGFGDRLLYRSVHGSSLWLSDGTDAGTAQLTPEAVSVVAEPVTVVGSRAFFSGADATHGLELWVTDGTAAGTTLVVDLVPGPSSSGASFLTAFQGRVFFWAVTGNAGWEPWMSDGTAAGTVPLASLAPQIGTSAGTQSIEAGADGVYFWLEKSGGAFELWRSDATGPGTLKVDAPGFSGELFAVGSRLFGFGVDVWVTDGTAAGTVRLLADRQGRPLAVVDGILYFAAPRCDVGCVPDDYLWRTDGTTAGTYLVEGSTGDNVLGPRKAVSFAGRLVFIASFGADAAIWESDGTASGTHAIRHLGSTGFFEPELALAGQKVYFSGFDPIRGQELWAIHQ